MAVALDAAFLADIIEHPNDRTPRLIYADWLEDHHGDDPPGLALAHFIRAQCAAESLDPQDPGQRIAKVAAEKLLDRHETTWAAPLKSFARRWEFRGGFAEKVWAAPGILVDHGGRLLAHIPIRSLALRQAGGGWTQLMRCPHLERLEELEVGSTFHNRPRWLEQLAASPHLGRLRKLVLDRNPLPNNGTILASRQPWPALEDLTLACDYSRREFPGEFLRGKLADNLVRLDLAMPYSDESLLSRLDECPWSRLTSITLRNLHVHDYANQALAGLSFLGRVREFSLRDSRLASGGLDRFLVNSRLGGNLESLTLTDCFSDPTPGVPQLPLERWPNLRVLRLGQSQCDRILPALRREPKLPHLHTLEITCVSLGQMDVEILLDALTRSPIRSLSLASARLDDVALIQLVRSPALAGVQELDLSWGVFTDRGAQAMLDAPGLAGLLRLKIRGCRQMTNVGRKALIERFSVVEVQS